MKDALSDAEMRDIELEENENRKALTEGERARSFESSKKILNTAAKAAELISVAPTEKPKARGRPPKHAVSREEIAEASGISIQTLRGAEQHIETAERFPWMQGEAWRQTDVLKFRAHLQRIPAKEWELPRSPCLP
jgi:hypothetical protein